MRPTPVRLDQGVVVRLSPTEMEAGELILARNCHYEPDARTLFRVGGRRTFGTVNAGSAVSGVAFVQFRNGNKYVLAASGQTYKAASVNQGARDGQFVSLRTLTNPAGKMEAAYYNGTDRVYLMDGTNRAQVWDGVSGTMRNMGLLTPLVAPTVTLLSNAATYYTTGTTFLYCYTEFDAANNIESAPSPVVDVQITVTGQTIKIQPNYVFNCETVRYRVYRSQDGGAVFYLIADLDIGFTTYYDGSNTEGGATDRIDNGTVWGFITMPDDYLQTQPVLPMLGQPLTGNYMTVNGEVPKGDICFVFEGSLIITGIKDFPQDVYYSLPDDPEMFPPVYFLRVENARGDPVTGGGVANDRMIIFTENSIYRYDTLPRITDPGFGLGLASKKLVTSDHGCVAKRTVVNFGITQGNNKLFYLSARGPFESDGYSTRPLGTDLDWTGQMLNYAFIKNAVAVNYPRWQQIWLFVPSAASSTNDMAFIYHYAPMHVKESTGVGKWTGPIDIRCDSACAVPSGSAETRLFIADTNTSSKVYLQDDKDTDDQNFYDSSGNIHWEWETGEMVFGSQARNKRVGRAFLTMQGTDPLTSSTMFAYAMNQHDAGRTLVLTRQTSNSEELETFGTSGVIKVKDQVYRTGVWKTGTHIRFAMAEVGAEPRGITSLEIEIEDYGKAK